MTKRLHHGSIVIAYPGRKAGQAEQPSYRKNHSFPSRRDGQRLQGEIFTCRRFCTVQLLLFFLYGPHPKLDGIPSRSLAFPFPFRSEFVSSPLHHASSLGFLQSCTYSDQSLYFGPTGIACIDTSEILFPLQALAYNPDAVGSQRLQILG